MRYIKTSNNYVEFIEADDSQNILSVRGFQFGELYFQIKNKKVTFYLNDQENPWRNDVWTINIPFELDGELYEDEDSAAAALEAIINDSFQEQLDEIKEDLADEVTRSTAKDAEHDALISALTEDLEALAEDLEDEIERSTAEDARLDQKIDDEIADRISGDTYLEGLINAESARAEGAESAITAALNAEISRSTAKDNEHDALISGLTSDLADEVARSTAKDAEHDAEISGLTADLNNEITRAMSAETVLHDEILAEEARALAAESALTDALNDEITRSTAKDASHDAEISGLTTSLQNEINRAVGAENSLRNDLNDEVSARTSADSAMVQKITALEVGKANKSDVYTKAESDNKYATKEYVSGNTYTKAEIATMMADKADKLNAVSTALYNSQNKTIDFKNIYGNVIASVDARDFIKDGMVNNAYIENNNLVITFNTDAGLEDIVVPLTDIFDPSNYYTKAETDEAIADAIDDIDLSDYYTKSEVDASQAAQDNKINVISGNVDTISANTYTKTEVDASQLTQDNKINAISGDIQTISGDVQTLSGKVDTISGDVITLGGDVQTLSGEVQTISGSAITSGDVQTQIDNSISGKADKTEIYTYVGTDRIKVSTAAGVRRKAIDLNLPIYSGSAMSSLSLNSVIGTAQGGNQINGDFSTGIGLGLKTKNPSEVATGQYNISNTVGEMSWGNSGNTLFSVGNGDHQGNEHNAFEVRQNGDIYISSGGTTSSLMIKLQDHLGGGGGGVTPTEVQTMIDNSLVGYQVEMSAGTNVQINNNVISATDTKYTAGDGISISNQNVISTVTKFWCGTQAQYDAITTKDSNTVYMIHE